MKNKLKILAVVLFIVLVLLIVYAMDLQHEAEAAIWRAGRLT